MLNINNAYKKFGSSTVLENINLSFEEGKIVGLLGENGAGKTTLLRSMIGIYNFDKGNVTINNADVFNNADAKQLLGFVTDEIEVFPFTRVESLVEFYKNIYKNFSIEKFNKLNKIYKIDTDKKIMELTKGYKMRLSIILNLAINPKFLLLDEPTNGLDIMSKKQFFEMIVEEVETNNTGIIISSHNIKDLEIICDKICILNKGKVIMDKDVDEMRNDIIKLQVLFKNKDVDFKSIKGLLDYKKEGSIYYLYIKDYKEDVLDNYETILVEKCVMSIEDIFIKVSGGY